MYAMILDENREFQWREVPDPVRKADEVIIEVHAAAATPKRSPCQRAW